MPIFAALAFILLHMAVVRASILGGKQLIIDFTQTNASSQCTWSPSARYGITSEGLGWDRSPDEREVSIGSILTRPLGIAFFWRPTTSVSIKVGIQPEPGISTIEGTPYPHDPGRTFVRHSPDLVHWSSWQELQPDSISYRVLTGRIGIPRRERNVYENLRIEYETSNPSEGSNEEAVVRWITKNNPEFFAKHLPFIGYVQLLFESQFVAGYRFKKLDASFSYFVGGLHTEPSDPKENEQFRKHMTTVPWRFEGAAKPETTE